MPRSKTPTPPSPTWSATLTTSASPPGHRTAPNRPPRLPSRQLVKVATTEGGNHMHALHAARRITFTAPLATVLLASLAIVPALVSPASASATVLKDLQVTSATCSGGSVTAQGMAASSQLFLLVI